MDVELQPATQADRPVLRQLMELYRHDFSEWDGSDVDEQGFFGSPYLDRCWIEPAGHPFLIRADGKLAGFVLLSRHSHLMPQSRAMAVAEFFVLRKHRRHGVGRRAAIAAFDRFPGAWEVAQMAENVGAQAFWREVIDSYTGGRYVETVLDDERWRGPIQSFDNSR
jgi:predicted acetyltransferase